MDKASVEEGGTAIFTVTASRAVSQNTTVSFRVVVDQTADNAGTSLANAHDFAAGLLAANNVVIAKGAKTAQFEVKGWGSDGSEIAENYSVTAVVGGKTLTQEASLSDDGHAGQTFTLTTAQDTVPSAAISSAGHALNWGDDAIDGVWYGASNPATTLQATDVIDGGEGTDTLTVMVNSAEALPLANVSWVEVLNVLGPLAEQGVQVTLGDIVMTAGSTLKVSQQVGDSAGLTGGGADTTHSLGNIDITASATTTQIEIEQSAPAVAAGSVLGVNPGVVTIAGGVALASVSLVGYAAAGSQITGPGNSLLGSLTLSQGGDLKVESAANDVDMTLAQVSGEISLGTTTKLTLALENTAPDLVKVVAPDLESLVVTGTGHVSLTDTALLSIDARDLESGAITAVLADQRNSVFGSYIGSAVTDHLSLVGGESSLLGPSDASVDLGDGDDVLRITAPGLYAPSSGIQSPVLKGGVGQDRLIIYAHHAGGLSLDDNFARAIDGFERLVLEWLPSYASDATINMQHMDGITYVSNNNQAPVLVGLTLDNMAEGSTLELTGSQALGADRTAVNLASGASSFNLVLDLTDEAAPDGDVQFGTVELGGVTTLALSVADNAQGTGASLLELQGADLTHIVLQGSDAFELVTTSVPALSGLDASAFTGQLTYAAAGQVAMTIKGGSGDDILKASVGASAVADVIQGGGQRYYLCRIKWLYPHRRGW